MSDRLSAIKKIIQAGGGQFVKAIDNSIIFLDPLDGRKISLYTDALRTVDDVKLALKSHRERMNFQPWMPERRMGKP